MEQGENQSLSNMIFHAGLIPDGFQFGYVPYLFNTLKHRLTQQSKNWHEFHCLDVKEKKVLASIYFHVSGNRAVSPSRAPFGGFEVSTHLPMSALFEFISFMQQALRDRGIQEIEIKAMPELYTQEQPSITGCLLNHGFTIAVAELSACITVDKIPLKEKMSKDKRARLRQCLNKGLTFKKLSLAKLTEVYRFIENCRTRQGRQLSMRLDELQKTIAAIPKTFFLVAVFDGKRMVCACIGVHVRTDVVYTFYSAHDADYDQISPRVFLLSNLYNWCFDNSVRLLDLGTSAVDGKPNFPLLDFKQRVGATLTHKFTFHKALA